MALSAALVATGNPALVFGDQRAVLPSDHRHHLSLRPALSYDQIYSQESEEVSNDLIIYSPA